MVIRVVTTPRETQAAVHCHSLDRLNTINDSPPKKKNQGKLNLSTATLTWIPIHADVSPPDSPRLDRRIYSKRKYDRQKAAKESLSQGARQSPGRN